MVSETDYPIQDEDHEDYDPDDDWEPDREEDKVVDEGIQILNARRFQTVWSEIKQSHDRVLTELSQFVADAYNEYDPEDIDSSNLLTPTDMFEASAEEDSGAYSDAALRAIGLPRAGDNMDITLHDDERTVEGRIFALDAELSLETGTEYDPDEDFPDTSLYLSYRIFEDGDPVDAETMELNQPFTVDSAVDDDGEEVEEVTFDDGPDYDPSETEEIMEQLKQQQQELLEMQEEAAEMDGGLFAGGGFLSSLGPDLWLTDDSLISGIPNYVPTTFAAVGGYIFISD